MRPDLSALPALTALLVSASVLCFRVVNVRAISITPGVLQHLLTTNRGVDGMAVPALWTLWTL